MRCANSLAGSVFFGCAYTKHKCFKARIEMRIFCVCMCNLEGKCNQHSRTMRILRRFDLKGRQARGIYYFQATWMLRKEKKTLAGTTQDEEVYLVVEIDQRKDKCLEILYEKVKALESFRILAALDLGQRADFGGLRAPRYRTPNIANVINRASDSRKKPTALHSIQVRKQV
jgi:hypothetical protein